MRGFACVGLHHAKNDLNIGKVLRACSNFNVAMLAVSGGRNHYHRSATDTGAAYRHLPFLLVDDLHSVVPFGCIPIAIDLVPNAENLIHFIHPERAFYIFGPEDGTLGGEILDWCKYKLYVPTNRCMNLAATVHVVLYDRMAKEWGEQTLLDTSNAEGVGQPGEK